MLGIGRSWPIPWTLAAHVLHAARSIDEAREQLERLTQRKCQQGPHAMDIAGAACYACQEYDAMPFVCCYSVAAIPGNPNGAAGEMAS